MNRVNNLLPVSEYGTSCVGVVWCRNSQPSIVTQNLLCVNIYPPCPFSVSNQSHSFVLHQCLSRRVQINLLWRCQARKSTSCGVSETIRVAATPRRGKGCLSGCRLRILRARRFARCYLRPKSRCCDASLTRSKTTDAVTGTHRSVRMCSEGCVRRSRVARTLRGRDHRLFSTVLAMFGDATMGTLGKS